MKRGSVKKTREKKMHNPKVSFYILTTAGAFVAQNVFTHLLRDGGTVCLCTLLRIVLAHEKALLWQSRHLYLRVGLKICDSLE